jgi:hypothetical protein
MKQFIHSSGPTLIVAFNNVAYAVASASLGENVPEKLFGGDIRTVELLSDTATATAKPDRSDIGLSEGMLEMKRMNTIQAVSSHWMPELEVIMYAVSRFDKTLSIYSVSANQLITQNSESSSDTKKDIIKIKPIITHKTIKRSCSLVFTSVPSLEKGSKAKTIIVAGDLNGDAIAYSTEKDGDEDCRKSRVLLGHTASMITSIEIVDDGRGCSKILTSDRDEKVRISSFPQTFHVEGYLLGHSSYVSDVKVMKNNTNGSRCITCSGDGKLRLFDYETCKELASTNIPHKIGTDNKVNEVKNESSALPVRITINNAGTVVAVMYESFDSVELFSININSDGAATFEPIQSIECLTNPLAITFSSDDSINILTGEPKIIRMTSNEDGFYTNVGDNISAIWKDVISQEISTTMPKSLLETDKNTGKLKLNKKINEGNDKFVKNEPWFNRERIDTYKAGVQRRKQRKFEQQRQSNN